MDIERKSMKQILKFKLDNATYEKWELYKGLIPMIDQVCTDNGLFIESRIPNEKDHTVVVTSFANNETCIINACIHGILLLEKHGLSAAVVEAKRIRNPENYQIRLTCNLQVGYQNKKNLDKWLELSHIVDSFAGLRTVKLKREWNFSEFAMDLTGSFVNPIAWTQVSFYSGALYAKNKLAFDLNEWTQPIEQEDILDELIALSSNHRQLSFDHVLLAPKPKLKMRG